MVILQSVRQWKTAAIAKSNCDKVNHEIEITTNRKVMFDGKHKNLRWYAFVYEILGHACAIATLTRYVYTIYYIPYITRICMYICKKAMYFCLKNLSLHFLTTTQICMFTYVHYQIVNPTHVRKRECKKGYRLWNFVSCTLTDTYKMVNRQYKAMCVCAHVCVCMRLGSKYFVFRNLCKHAEFGFVYKQ